MSQHLEKHRNEQSGKKWTCEQCLDKPTYKTKSNFDQHTRGLHGPGFKSRCGEKNYKWPQQRKDHQKDCDKCKKVLEDHLNLPQNPTPKKLRKVLKVPAFNPKKENDTDNKAQKEDTDNSGKEDANTKTDLGKKSEDASDKESASDAGQAT